MRLRPPVGGEGKAPHPDGPGAGGGPGRLVGQTPARHLGAANRQIGETPGPAGDGLVNAPERGDREALPVRLLPAEPAVARQPRGEDGRARILQLERDRGADQAPAIARLGEQPLE